MKKCYIISFLAIFAIACNQNNDSNREMNNADKEALSAAIADRDSLLSLVNDISTDIAKIKNLEQIVSVPNSLNDEISENGKIKDDIEAIKQTLEHRQAKLAELENRLKKSRLNNSKLEQTIKNLKGQLEQQKTEIERLTNELTTAKARIGILELNNDSLNIAISNVSAEKDTIEKIATQAINDVNELNKCYYAIGSKKELKEKKILESGFLKKTKLMQGDFDKSFFNISDKRTTTTINLHSKKAKILTNHPNDSYQIIEQDGQMVLIIRDAKSFWNRTNYLVIQVD